MLRNLFTRRSSGHAAPAPRPRPLGLEQLEPRVLFSGVTYGIEATTPDRFGSNDTLQQATFLPFDVAFEGGIERDLTLHDSNDVDYFWLHPEYLFAAMEEGSITVQGEGADGLILQVHDRFDQEVFREGVFDGTSTTVDTSTFPFFGLDEVIFSVRAGDPQQAPTAYHLKIVTTPTATTDYDFNGVNDVVLRDENTGENSILLLDEQGTQISKIQLPNVDTSWTLVGTEDIDGVGDKDLVFHNKTTGQMTAMLVKNAVRTGWMPMLTLEQGKAVGGLADFNRDAKVDVVVRDEATGNNTILEFDNQAVVATHELPRVTSDWKIGGVTKTGRHQAAIAFRNTQTGGNTIMKTSNFERVGWTELPRVTSKWSMGGMTRNGWGGEIVFHNSQSGKSTKLKFDATGRTGWTAIPKVDVSIVPII